MIDSDTELPDPSTIPVVNGKAESPRCGEKIPVGTSGVQNMYKNHTGKQKCNGTRKTMKHKAKQSSLLRFMKPKAKPVPSTVPNPTPITTASNASAAAEPHLYLPSHPFIPLPAYLQKLEDSIQRLSTSVKEGDDANPFSEFLLPEKLIPGNVPADCIWEGGINKKMHVFQGMSAEDMKPLLRRGPKGVEAYFRFVSYFVMERGVDPVMFEPRTEVLNEAMEDYLDAPLPKLTDQANIEPDVNLAIGSAPEITTIDHIDLTNDLVDLARINVYCKGYELTFPEGTSPHTTYPFTLHHYYNLPWVYSVGCDNQMILQSRECTDDRDVEDGTCGACRCLARNEILAGIVERFDALPDKVKFIFHGYDQLIEQLHRKDHHINSLKLQVLNNTRLLQNRAKALDDHKRFIRAIKDENVEAVDRLIRGLLVLHEAAVEGTYHPKSYEEPTPQMSVVEWNIDSVLDLEQLAEQLRGSGFIHVVLMFDELAVEQRIHYDNQSNSFLGVCREHGGAAGLSFNTVSDLEQLYESLDEGEIHYASEATVGAIGILTDNKQFYNARPIFVSGTCKREPGEEQAKIIQLIYDAFRKKFPDVRTRIISLASDGEQQRGKALDILTYLKNNLSEDSNIYPLLSHLRFMNLRVGNDDLTSDKDFRHCLKCCHEALLRAQGLDIMGTIIIPAFYTLIFVKPLLRDVRCLPEVSSGTLQFVAERKALKLIGTLFYDSILFPYICVDLSLSEQLECFSAAAHLLLVLYQHTGKKFLPTLLYQDLQIMIKNIFFCVAKGIVDNPSGRFWICLLGTDRLEQLFGILRSMVGNDANLDVLQLLQRITGTVEIANILAKHPEWDNKSRHLRLPAVNSMGQEILGAAIDHISPVTWRGDVRLSQVTLLTCWKAGLSRVVAKFPNLQDLFHDLNLDTRPIDILMPDGVLLIGRKLDSDDVEEYGDHPVHEATDGHFDAFTEESGIRSLEDTLADEIEDEGAVFSTLGKTHNAKIDLGNGVLVNKSRVLGQFSRLQKHAPTSTDRLRASSLIDTSSPFGESCLMISEPIASVISCEGKPFLCIGKVLDICAGANYLDDITHEDLLDEGIYVTFQLVHLRPATIDDDPTKANDWRSSPHHEFAAQQFTVPGHLVQPLDPALNSPPENNTKTFYLFDSATLLSVAESLLHKVAELGSSQTLKIPSTQRSDRFPYLTRKGTAAFLCDDMRINSADINGVVHCPICINPSISFDAAKPQKILKHIGAHILNLPANHCVSEPCGFCMSPALQCLFYLTAGLNKLDKKRSTCPVWKMIKGFSYKAAGTGSTSNPCTNIPVQCDLCARQDPKSPAVWRYNLHDHYKKRHPNANRDKLWKLSASEKAGMTEAYKNRHKVSRKQGQNKERERRGALQISSAHRTGMTYRTTDVEGDDSEGNGSDEESNVEGSDRLSDYEDGPGHQDSDNNRMDSESSIPVREEDQDISMSHFLSLGVDDSIDLEITRGLTIGITQPEASSSFPATPIPSEASSFQNDAIRAQTDAANDIDSSTVDMPVQLKRRPQRSKK
ncbi:hypothetical protein D9758_018620 [Tetrapyrgos nigripes]|uniref:Uncharacterized protein n=1 Tax=Tetrapyrgos nigripes TaxID=182062 RepID=A0A8H5C526_9AGAR|nr:hypothetical protein D9758_018620 [Tetrapyrgos nigripes]